MAQAAARVILVRPTGFDHDPQTAGTNAFQNPIADRNVKQLAGEEFDELLDALRNCGIGITVLDPIDPQAPNAVFPNNWFSTHEDGTLVIYPMFAPSRRTERDPQLAERLSREGARIERSIDISDLELRGQFLEGTGSLVLDRKTRIAYACLSARTDEKALSLWCDRMKYKALPFTATIDGTLTGQPIYHTNVVMSIGEAFAVVCLDAIAYPAERQEVKEELERSGKEVIAIGIDQMHKFLGNLLQLKGKPIDPRSGGDRFIFLSQTAFHALRSDQRLVLEKHGQLVPVPIPTIETVGGGSVRCMLAENFLPER